MQEIKPMQRSWRDRFWSSVAKAYDFPLLQRVVYRPTQQELLTHIEATHVNRILDVGCGTGEFTQCLANHFMHAEVTGLDMARGMIAEAETKLAMEPHRINFVIGDAQQMDWPDEYYDLITCTNSLIFYADPLQALREMYRLLVPGAQLGVVNLVMPKWAATVHLHLSGIHLPTLQHMRCWCEQVGFEVKEAGYVHPKLAWVVPFGYLVGMKG